jgi:hypothetical protein
MIALAIVAYILGALLLALLFAATFIATLIHQEEKLCLLETVRPDMYESEEARE